MKLLVVVFMLGVFGVNEITANSPVSEAEVIVTSDCNFQSLIPKNKKTAEYQLLEEFREIIEKGGYPLRYGYAIKVIIILKPIVENNEVRFILERLRLSGCEDLYEQEATEVAISDKVETMLPALPSLIDTSKLNLSCDKLLYMLKFRVCG